jgi:hypothetical protein
MAGITLTGPNPAQPFDIQTQQAQLAQAQQIALAMIQQGLEPGSPVIHTGGNNPFARDVVNLAPLGKIGETILAKHNLGTINQQQQDLANQVIARRQEGLKQAFGPEMPNGSPTVMGTQQPGILQSAKLLLASPDPNLQQLGGNMMAMVAKGEESRQATPQAVADFVGRGRIDPASLHLSTTLFGFPSFSQQDYNNMKRLPDLVTQTPGQQTSTVPLGGANAGTPPQVVVAPHAALPATLTPPGGAMPGGGTNPQPVTMQTSALSGETSPVAGPATTAVALKLDNAQKEANLNFNQVQGFQENLPRYLQMAQIVNAARQKGNFGAFGNEVNFLRKLSVQLGVSQDTANKVTDFETFNKYAVPEAASNAREGVGSRVAVVEFQSFLNSLGAGGSTDPRAMMNIIQQKLLEGINNNVNQQRIYNPNLAAQGGDPTGMVSSLDPFEHVVKPLVQMGIKPAWTIGADSLWRNNVGSQTTPGVSLMPQQGQPPAQPPAQQ